MPKWQRHSQTLPSCTHVKQNVNPNEKMTRLNRQDAKLIRKEEEEEEERQEGSGSWRLQF